MADMPQNCQDRRERPLLSIIIVAYKSRDEIGSCLASLPRTLEGGAVECVLVDNSPGDGTGELVRKVYPWVKYIEPAENIGFGRANNLGFASSSGHHVLFLNPDTVSNTAALEHCLGLLRSDPSIGMVSPRLVMADGRMDLACRRSIPSLWDGFCRAAGLAALFPRSRLLAGYNLTWLSEEGRHEVGAINGAFMLGRRSLFSELAGPSGREVFDEQFFMYGDDLDLCIRVSRTGRRIVYDGSHSIIHLKGQSVGRDYDRMSQAIFDANRDVYLKHFNPHGSALLRLKYRLAFGLWKRIALLRARLRGHRAVRPV